jgi:RimJ/RimL family protein N-acetyltransferase
MKRVRHLYGLSGHQGAWRSSLRSPAADARLVTPADSEALAVLMLEAYRGTIDSAGETLADAQAEVRGFFDGQYGPPLLDACIAIDHGGVPIATALICDWNERHQIVAGPLVAFVLVHPDFRGRGHGIAVMNASLTRLVAAGWGRVYAVITEGNAPSQALFGKLGFKALTRE